jgi:hypothetical protein
VCQQSESWAHTWDNRIVTKEPTCKEEGSEVYTCVGCGDVRTTTIPKLTIHSHGEGEVVKEPTCTKNGKKIYICIVCGTTETEKLPMLAHEYVDGVCVNCNRAEPSTPTTPILPEAPNEEKPMGFFEAIAAFFESIFRVLFWFLYL